MESSTEGLRTNINRLIGIDGAVLTAIKYYIKIIQNISDLLSTLNTLPL